MMLDVCSFLNTPKHHSKKWNLWNFLGGALVGVVAIKQQPQDGNET